MLNFRFNVLAIPLVLFMLLSACATPTLKPVEENMAPMKNTINEIDQLETELEKARQNQLDILSPGWFAKAEASFDKAKAKAEKGTELKDISEDIADAQRVFAECRGDR